MDITRMHIVGVNFWTSELNYEVILTIERNGAFWTKVRRRVSLSDYEGSLECVAWLEVFYF